MIHDGCDRGRARVPSVRWPKHTGCPRATRVRLACGAIAFVLVIALGPGAGLSSDAFGAQAAPPKVIRLVSVNLTFRLVVDKAPLGTSKGDTIQTTNVLSNAVAQLGLAKGAVVGSDAGRATNVDAVPMTVDVLVRL